MKKILCLLLLLPLSGCFSYQAENEYERAAKKASKKADQK